MFGKLPKGEDTFQWRWKKSHAQTSKHLKPGAYNPNKVNVKRCKLVFPYFLFLNRRSISQLQKNWNQERKRAQFEGRLIWYNFKAAHLATRDKKHSLQFSVIVGTMTHHDKYDTDTHYNIWTGFTNMGFNVRPLQMSNHSSVFKYSRTCLI
jgi:hypothetical protein